MSASQRNKGAKAERSVVAWFRAHGFDGARRFLAGDGRQPGDVDGVRIRVDSPNEGYRDACVEVKDCATYDLAGWMRQAEQEARPGQVPVVIFHPHGVSEVGDWFLLTRPRHLFDSKEQT